MGWSITNQGNSLDISYQAATASEGVVSSSLEWWVQVIPVLWFPVMITIGAFVIWWFLGRDPKGRGLVVTEFEEPHQLPPALLALIYKPHKATQDRFMGATFLQWARQGIVEIVVKTAVHPKQAGRYWYAEVTKKRSLPDTALPFERVLMEGAFAQGETINARLMSGFSLSVKTSESMYQELAARHLFEPMSTKISWMFLLGALTLLVLAGFFTSPLAIVSTLLSSVALFVFGALLPKTTPHGAVVREKVLGFYTFLRVTEVRRLEELFPVREGVVQQIPEFLPSAVALGLDARWARLFEPLPERITPMELLSKSSSLPKDGQGK